MVVRPSRLSAQMENETKLTSDHFFILLSIGGYIPIHDSYRINYETQTFGLPIEIDGGLLFPASERLSVGMQLRYKRREASFVPDMSIATLELEPMAHYYLDKPRPDELRIYGLLSILLARETVAGNIESTRDGVKTISVPVSKGYYNIGFGIGLGVEYPVTTLSALFADVHFGTYFADATGRGGLGNLGGITISIGYKLGI